MVRWKKNSDKTFITSLVGDASMWKEFSGSSRESLNDMKLSEAMKLPPSVFIEKPEQWCPMCHNARTKIPTGDLTRAYDKPYVRLIKDFIIQNNMYKFTKDELIDNMQIRLYTDGTLQMTGLGILVLNGFLTRINEKFFTKDKKGKEVEHIRSVFIRNEILKIPICVKENKHISKIIWEETQIFGLNG